MEAFSHSDAGNCSFSNRPAAEAGPLVAGTGDAFICQGCVDRLFHAHHIRQAREQYVHVSGHMDRFTEPARRVLTLVQEEAQRFNHDYIGTEHLLLGLIREGEGIAAGVLESLGVNLAKVRSEVITVLTTPCEPPSRSAPADG